MATQTAAATPRTRTSSKGRGLPVHPTARIVCNPNAGGTGRRGALREAAGVLADRGWTISWRNTERAGHAVELAEAAAREGLDFVVSVGGDGTINEIVNGLVGTDTALAVLPAGTGNVLAAQLGQVGVPTPLHRAQPGEAARGLVEGRVHQVDVGLAIPRSGPSRHFLLMAGVGLDASITKAVEEDRDLKRAIGPAAFGAVGIRTLARLSGTRALVRFGETRLKDTLLLGVVSNIRLYAGSVELSPNARVDDGRLDLELYWGQGPMAFLGHLGSMLTGRREGEPAHHSAQVESVRFVTREPLPVQLDGDPFGETPMTIRVRPRCLGLLVPPGAPEGLFA